MRASVSMAENDFAQLRRRIAEIEGRPVVCNLAASGEPLPPSPLAGEEYSYSLGSQRSRGILPFILPRLDGMLAGGLRRNALHEVRSDTARDAAAATGFAAAILARLACLDRRPVLWVAEATALHEAGLPYGVGLDCFGYDSRRLILVRVKKPSDALWVFEEGLSCRGLAAVLAEIRGNPHSLDLTATRRLALRAEAGGVMGLLLRQAGEPNPTAAQTRWNVAPLPAATTDDFSAGIGRPAWRLTLERNRRGQTGTADVEWDHERRAFAIAEASHPAHSRSVAALSADRPDPAPDERSLVA